MPNGAEQPVEADAEAGGFQSARLFHDKTEQAVREQRERVRGINDRLTAALQVVAVIVAVAAVVLLVRDQDPASHVRILAAIVLALFAVTLIAVRLAFVTAPLKSRTNLRELRLRSLSTDEESLLRWWGNELLRDYRDNESRIARKDRLANAALTLATLDGVLAAIAAVLAIVS